MQDNAAAIAEDLTALLSDAHSSHGTAFSVRRCLGQIFKAEEDAFSTASSVACSLLHSARATLSRLSAPASERAHTEELPPAEALRKAEAQFQLLAIFAAEKPALLTSLVKKMLGAAFPHHRWSGLELVQKWALDAVASLAANAATKLEVRFHIFSPI